MDLDALAKAAAARKAQPVDLDAIARKAAARKKSGADMSVMGRLRDNIVGVDDGVMSFGEKVATALNKAGESLTLGVVGDEAAAAADSLVGRGDYAGRRDKYRADERQFARENPKTALAVEIAPALLPGAGLAGAAINSGMKLPRAVSAATTGAVAGGTYSFAEGEGTFEDRRESALAGLFAGGLLGAAAPKMTDFAASIPSRVRRMFSESAKRPTVPMLRETKSAAYRAVDDAGEVFDGEAMTSLATRVRQTFEADNYVPETDDALTATLKLLDSRAGQPTTLTQLDKLRQNLWKRYSFAKDQPQILDAIRMIDETIGEASGASELMQVARAANARYAKSQLIEDAFTKATDQTASTGSGGNILNKYRQAVTSIINNPKKARFFSEDEIGLMREFVRGNMSENIMRRIGKLSPNGNGLMMTLHAVGGVASNGASIPVAIAGEVAKKAADNSVMRRAGAIQDTVAGVPQIQPVNSLGFGLATGAAPVSERLGDIGLNALVPLRSQVPR